LPGSLAWPTWTSNMGRCRLTHLLSRRTDDTGEIVKHLHHKNYWVDLFLNSTKRVRRDSTQRFRSDC
jgi:hypothetical protein